MVHQAGDEAPDPLLPVGRELGSEMAYHVPPEDPLEHEQEKSLIGWMDLYSFMCCFEVDASSNIYSSGVLRLEGSADVLHSRHRDGFWDPAERVDLANCAIKDQARVTVVGFD